VVREKAEGELRQLTVDLEEQVRSATVMARPSHRQPCVVLTVITAMRGNPYRREFVPRCPILQSSFAQISAFHSI